MRTQPLELEGTWEEISQYSENFKDQRLRLTIITDETEETNQKIKRPSVRLASGRSILRHAGTWSGDDLEECLQLVYDMRGPVEF